jgi:hypothetical protein
MARDEEKRVGMINPATNDDANITVEHGKYSALADDYKFFERSWHITIQENRLHVPPTTMTLSRSAHLQETLHQIPKMAARWRLHRRTHRASL